jgi:hypothetical protein
VVQTFSDVQEPLQAAGRVAAAAVISFDWKEPDWISQLGCRIPDDVGFVS